MANDETVSSIEDVQLPKFTTAIKRVGPAFVLGAGAIGPGSLVLSSLNGALFGYQLLWVLVISAVFMIAYVEMGARIGIAGDAPFWTTVREKYGSIAGIAGGVIAFLVALGFGTGNVIGVGLGMQAIFGGSLPIWSTTAAIVAIGFLLLQGLYDKLERLILLLILLMVAGFIGTLAITGFEVGGAASGVIPSIPSEQALFLGIAMMATFFNPFAAVYQSYLVQEKNYTRDDLGEAIFDSIFAMVVLGILLIAILLTAAAVLNPAGVIPQTAADIALQLEPLAGQHASLLFGMGIFAAAFSSIIVAAIQGGTMFSDGLGYATTLDDWSVKLPSIAIVIIAWGLATIPTLLGRSPIDTLVLGQAFAGIAIPYFGLMMLLLANDRSYLEGFTNTTFRNAITIFAYIIAIGIGLYYILSVLGVI